MAGLAVGLIGMIIEICVLKPIYKAPELFQLVATFGVILVIQDMALLIWGPEDLFGQRAPGFEGAASSQASPPSSPTSGRASPGLKRKCSAARAESSRPGATVVVVNMGAGAPEASTSHSPHQSPHGSPKGAELKRPKSGVDLASLAYLLG